MEEEFSIGGDVDTALLMLVRLLCTDSCKKKTLQKCPQPLSLQYCSAKELLFLRRCAKTLVSLCVIIVIVCVGLLSNGCKPILNRSLLHCLPSPLILSHTERTIPGKLSLDNRTYSENVLLI